MENFFCFSWKHELFAFLTLLILFAGPNHWVENYGTCVGKHQSPINIEEHFVTEVFLLPLQFSGVDVEQEFELENNGHTGKFNSPHIVST